MKNTSFHFAKFFGYFLKNGENYIKNQIKSNYSAILDFIWICLYFLCPDRSFDQADQAGLIHIIDLHDLCKSSVSRV